MIHLKFLTPITAVDVETPRVRVFCRSVDNLADHSSLVIDCGEFNIPLCVFVNTHTKDFGEPVSELFLQKLLQEDPNEALDFVKYLSCAPSEPLPQMLHFNIVSIWTALTGFRIPQKVGEEVKNVS